MYLVKLPGKYLNLKHLLPFCLLIGYLLVSFYSISQVLEENYPVVNSRRNSDGTYSFIRFAPDKGMKRPLTLSSENLASILNLPKNHELKLQANNNFKGNSELIFEEYFKGIPIEFSRLKLKTSNGQIISIAGRYHEVSENTPTTPRISESVAFEKAIAYLNAKQYSWEFDGMIEPELKTLPKGSLVLMERINETKQILTNSSSSFSLCFKFKIYTIEPLSYSEIFVDADNGNILFNNPILKHSDGIGDTKYSGRRNLKTLKFGGNFVLVDSSRTNPLHTLNLNRGFNYNLATDFTDKDNQWTEAEFNNPAQNQAALDAHWGAEKTFEFFKRKFNRNGFDGKGSLLKSYVHAGLKFSNAFWDGFSVTYGDGDSIYYGPFTSIDICAHEIGHAICQYSANLIYFRESGAINESLSDIWGACVKNYAAPEKNHWLNGDEVSLKNDFIRSFINPKAKGQPDTYKGENWYNGDFDNGGVHTNSGVMNYWFYLLSTGKNGTNDNGFNYQVTGIGIEKASQIVYRALTEYLYPTAQMIDARYTTIIAAIDIFGDNSIEVRQVIAAWDAVGVVENLPAPSALSISDSSSYIQLSWNYPLFVSDFNGFIIERQTGAFGNFVEIGRVGADEKSYSDFGFTPDSLLNYRVRAFKGNMISDWVVGFVSQGDGPLVMRNGTFTFCRKQFLDPGGSLPYKNNSIITTTIRPSFSGGRVGVRFYRFFLENQVDFLEIYNGSSINSPRLGVFTGKNIPGLLRSSDTSGALTFRFRSSNFITDSGWIAEFDCIDSVRIRPVIRDVVFDSVNRGARLNWADVGSKEISYIIERAVNDFGNNSFIEIGRVNQNETTFVDTTIPINTTVFYRVVANYIADTVIGFTRSFTYGAFPYIMRNGTFDSTCSKTFLDPGGLGNYSGSNTNSLQTVVLIPSGKDTKIELNFSRFKLFTSDYISIYNGFGVNKTLIATYYGYSAKPGKIRSTSADGRLTVEFFRHSSSPGDSGWVANISCYSFISQPDIVSVLPVGTSATNLEISWVDRSDIEDFYIVQRALNDTTSLAFKTVSILPANTTSFIDNIPQQDGVYSYRIIGVSNKDTTQSRTVTYNAGNHPVLMTDKLQVVTCDRVFMDPAGLGLYSQPSKSGTITTTFLPANPGDRLMVDFSVLKLANGDLLSASREGGQRFILGGNGSSSLPNRFKSKNDDGSITFYFDQSASGNSDSGWIGKISCYKPVQAPIIDSVVTANPKGIKIYWKEASNNATGYIIQRSMNDSTNRYMKTIATVSSGTFSFEDTSNIMNAWAFYRIIAFNDNDSSLSLSKGLLVGNEPKAMVDEEHIVSCDLTLLDMGGIGDYPFFLDKSFQKTVVIPDGEDRKLSIELLRIKLNRGEYLRFYDGNTVSSAYLIGEFTEGDTIPTTLKSKLGDGTITVSYENFFGGMNYGAWEARFTCYETILSPRLNEASVTGSGIELNWVDRSEDETYFIIQRALNDSTPKSFSNIAILEPNQTSFTDDNHPANGFIFYRVGTIKGTDTVFSNIVMISVGNIPLIITEYQELTTCDAVILDPGGLEPYVTTEPGKAFVAIIRPDNPNSAAEINFSYFSLNGSDILNIYSGEFENEDSLVGSFNSAFLPNGSIRSLSPSGSLCLVYKPYGDFPHRFAEHGWVANVSCYKILRAPEELHGSITGAGELLLNWQDIADDETQYLVQHAVNQPYFENNSFIANLQANATNVLHSLPQNNATNFYRVGAVRGIDTAWSTIFSIGIGNSPLISGRDTVVVTCQQVFMDPGGTGLYPAPNYFQEITTTFVPEVSGKKIGIDFKSFNLNWNDQIVVYSGDEYVYDNIIASFYGFDVQKPGRILSKSNDGKLSVRFYRQKGNLADSGWLANVFCYKEINRPTNPIVKRVSGNRYKVNFTDNSHNESGFVVEKCSGDCINFIPVDTLEHNQTEFFDSVSSPVNQVRYRIRAIYQDFSSPFSDTAILMLANGPLNMTSGNVSFSSFDLFDSGGPNDFYRNNEDFKLHLFPLDSGKKVRIAFETLSTESARDVIEIYSAAAPGFTKIASLSGNVIPQNPIISGGIDGTLRVDFKSNESFIQQGWKAKVSTVFDLAKPYGLEASISVGGHVSLSWLDTNKVAVSFILERAYGDTSRFSRIALLPSSISSFTDSNVATNVSIFYRVIALYNGEISGSSPVVSINPSANCTNLVLAVQSSTGSIHLNQIRNFLVDRNCNLIARLDMSGVQNVPSNRIRASVGITDTFPSFNGAIYGKRYYNIVPDNQLSSLFPYLTLYFTQADFDEFNKHNHGKLLPKNSNDTARYKNIRILTTPSEGIQLQNPGDYYLPPVEAVVFPNDIRFNSLLNAYEVRLPFQGAASFFLASANDTTITSCLLDSQMVSIQSNKIGYTYQWQIEKNGIFKDLQDDENFAFTRSAVLQFRKRALASGARLRCMVFFSPSKTYVVENNEMEWIGIFDNSWSNPANWSCGVVPGVNNRVRVKPGTPFTPSITSNITLKELMVFPGANISIAPGVIVTITD